MNERRIKHCARQACTGRANPSPAHCGFERTEVTQVGIALKWITLGIHYDLLRSAHLRLSITTALLFRIFPASSNRFRCVTYLLLPTDCLRCALPHPRTASLAQDVGSFLANHHHRAIMIDFGRSFVNAVLQLHVERGSAKYPMFSFPLAMPCTVVLW